MTAPVSFLVETFDAALARRVEAALATPPAATPASLRALASELDTLLDGTNRVARLMDGIRSLRDAVATSRDDPSDADGLLLRRLSLQARDEALEAGLRALRDRVRAVADALSGADQRAREALRIVGEAQELTERATAFLTAPSSRNVPEQETPPEPEDQDTCRVEGCTSHIKARGFCSRHYGQWYRGRLSGWVLADGLIRFHDGTRWRVDKALSGEPAERDEDLIRVGDAIVEARPVR